MIVGLSATSFSFQVPETPRDEAFCSYVALHKKPIVTLDATQDPRFHDNPLVSSSSLGIRYYAGTPVFAKGTNQCLGTVCIIDTKPRPKEDQLEGHTTHWKVL